jgi:hypothetical protein
VTKLLFSLLVLCATSLAVAVPAFAQGAADIANMQILRDKIKADKKVVVAANMELTDAEAAKFWPIYDAYQKDLGVINERLGKAILAYADAYKTNTLTDEQARTLIDEAIAIDDAEAAMRKTYAAKLAGAIPGKKAARYLQIESKIRAVIRYELAANVPLAQ